MKLIIGLGNPGKIYANTRHNIGFMVIDVLAQAHTISLRRGFFSASVIGKGKIGREITLLAKPLTFMNLSGAAAKSLLKKYGLSTQDILVVCDDMDLEFGTLRIRPSGSSGGHRGLKSIIESLDSEDFPRLRIGVGRPHKQLEPSDYVLDEFHEREKQELKGIIEKAVSCCESWVENGISETMNLYNKKGQG